MERLTEHVGDSIHIKGCTTLYPNKERKGAPLNNAIVRLCALEDAEEQGLLVRLPFPKHSILFNTSDKSPERLEDFRLSATWTHCGIVFHSPLDMFLEDVERGYIQFASEEAEKALKEANWNG